MLVYICYAFISAMCMFTSGFFGVFLFNCATCMFIVVCAIVRHTTSVFSLCVFKSAIRTFILLLSRV